MASNEENEIYESWEDMEDAGVLDKKIKILQTKSSTETPKTSNGGLVILDDSVRQYYGPPDPKVKILKRPTISSEGNQVNGDSRPRQHKTLKQREQEYAEARLRILGEARSPDESPTSPSAINANEGMNHLQAKLEVLTTSDQGKTTQGVVGELRPAKVVIESDNILRTPRGPDGTKGFKRR